MALGQVLENPIETRLHNVGISELKVYDLEIEGAPEFFAGNVLVHNSTKNGGDYTVGVKMGLHIDGSLWILDVVRGQWSTDERESMIVKTAQRDHILTYVVLEQEPGSSGVDSTKQTAKRLAGHRVISERSTGKKELRADTFSVQVNAGNVHMVKGHWNDDFITEMTHFPNSKHDDQVDAASLAFSHLVNKKARLGML